LTYVAKNSSAFSSTLFQEAQQWKGGSTDDFTKYICKIRKPMNELPPLIQSTFNESLVIKIAVTNLAQNENLKAIHTIICCKISDQPNCVTFQNIEEQVTRVLRDFKPSAVPGICNNNDVVASMVSFFTQQKNRSFQASCGKFQNAKAPVNGFPLTNKKRLSPQRISSAVWAKMSQGAEDQFLQEKRES
jgi:hypothetical protein